MVRWLYGTPSPRHPAPYGLLPNMSESSGTPGPNWLGFSTFAFPLLFVGAGKQALRWFRMASHAIVGMRSIRQSVQNGQFMFSLAQNAPHLLIASHAYEGIERLLVRVIVTAPAIDQTPSLQLIEPAYDCSTWHVP